MSILPDLFNPKYSSLEMRKQRSKNLYQALITLFILAVIPLTLVLTQQRHIIQKKAASDKEQKEYEINLNNVLEKEIGVTDNKEHVKILSIRDNNVVIKENNRRFDLNEFNYLNSKINSPGDPDLPGFSFKVLLPSEADLSSVELDYDIKNQETIKLDKKIVPESPLFTLDEQGEEVYFWGEEKNIVNEQNLNIYQNNTLYPEKVIYLSRTGQKRNLKVAAITVFPYQYNPVKNELVLSKSINFNLKYTRESTVTITSSPQLKLNKSEQDFTKYLVNERDFDTGYKAQGQILDIADGYAIITTDAIVNGSNKLTDFIAHKQNRGFDVYRIAESECLSCPSGSVCESCAGGISGWGTGGSLPASADRSHKIRDWLQNNYLSLNLQYALLIGNPDPYDPRGPSQYTGDVPMQMCWPMTAAGSPTDLYYAELTGNWNSDNDSYYCEYFQDNYGLGGVELEAEVLVGRIPVYSMDYGVLDKILQKTIDYEATVGDVTWRARGLFPMKPFNQDTLNWDTGEALSALFHSQGMESFRIYDENFGVTPPPELTPVNYVNVRNTWNGDNGLFAGGVGVVSWATHGISTRADNVIKSDMTGFLDDATPAFTFQDSCLNAHPETSNNLAFALLENGAIGTVGATRSSYGMYHNGYNYEQYCGATSPYIGLDCRYIKPLSQNNSSGASLELMRSSTFTSGYMGWVNMFILNLYGDPSISLNLPNRGAIEGRVNGQVPEVEEGKVIIFLKDGKTIAKVNSMSGDFSLPDVIAGDMTISAKQTGDILGHSFCRASEQQSIEVITGQTAHVELQVTQSCGVIRGQVVRAETSSPIGGAKVFLNSESTNVSTGQDGTFTLRNVFNGDYTISAEKGDCLYSEPQSIEVLPGQSVQIDISLLSRCGMVTGYIVEEGTGNPIGGAEIILDGQPIREFSSGGGAFILDALPSTHTINAQRIGYGLFADQQVEVFYNTSTEVTITLEKLGSWTEQISSTSNNLNSVNFVDSNHGWVVGDGGTVLATIDGGMTWSPQVSGVTNNFMSVYFINSQKGWIVGQNGKIIKTADGGNNWEAKQSGVTQDLNAVFFISAQEGWAVGNDGIIITTNDGGESWTLQYQCEGGYGSTDMHDVHFIDSNHGWAVGDTGRICSYNGSSWDPQAVFGLPLHDVHFVNTDYGWTVSDTTNMFVTYNGGKRWEPIHRGSAQEPRENLFGVHFINESFGWVVGENGSLLATVDNGKHWAEVESGTNSQLNSIIFIDERHGWTVGANGIVLTYSPSNLICIPGEENPELPGDLDCDCEVGIVDIMMVAAIWNTREGEEGFRPEFDFDGDGRISVVDIMYIVAKWSDTCAGVTPPEEPQPPAENPQVQISTTLDTTGIQPGDNFEAAVNIETDSTLGGFDYVLKYDPAVIEATGAKLGSALKGNPNEVPAQIDNNKGEVRFGAYSFQVPEGSDSSGLLANVQFLAKGEGTTELTFFQYKLLDNKAGAIPSRASTGSVEVKRERFSDLEAGRIKVMQGDREVGPVVGEPVVLFGEFKNIGEQETGQFYVEWYKDGEMVDRYLSQSIPADPNKVHTTQGYPWLVESGNHTFEFKLDPPEADKPNGRVEELDEENNNYELVIVPTERADLEVSEIKVFKPRTEEVVPEEELKVGQLVTLFGVLKNIGGQDTGTFNVKWFKDREQIGYGSHKNLPPDSDNFSRGNVRYDWTVEEGARTFKFEADVDRHVREGDEGNNSVERTITITQPVRDTLVVRAKGSSAWKRWPRMRIRVNGEYFKDSRGRILTTTVATGTYKDYEFEVPGISQKSAVDVVFINDAYSRRLRQDRNLYVDYIEVAGRRIQAEDKGVYYDRGRGSRAFDWQDVTDGQEEMYTSGALRFNTAGLQVLKVRAKGDPYWEYRGRGYWWPKMQIRVAGKYLRSGSRIQTTEVNTKEFKVYTFMVPELSKESKVDVAFINDRWNRWRKLDVNLFVDYIETAERTIQAEDGDVRYDRGSSWRAFDGKDVIPGREGMYWNGALRFNQPEIPIR